MNCQNCGKAIEGREDKKFCSDKCRVTFSRNKSVSVTDNVTFSDPVVTDNFEFTIKLGPNDHKRRLESNQLTIAEEKQKKRVARYWYEVPVSAVPVVKKDWPAVPGYMNGRQYFLWWKNEFETDKNGPVILNPYPKYDKVEYIQAYEGSRRYGA
jgi:hypothetical protein